MLTVYSFGSDVTFSGSGLIDIFVDFGAGNTAIACRWGDGAESGVEPILDCSHVPEFKRIRCNIEGLLMGRSHSVRFTETCLRELNRRFSTANCAWTECEIQSDARRGNVNLCIMGRVYFRTIGFILKKV